MDGEGMQDKSIMHTSLQGQQKRKIDMLKKEY